MIGSSRASAATETLEMMVESGIQSTRVTKPARVEAARSRYDTSRGFTLVEVIVVLAVVLLLSGIAVPMISGYVEDGRRARAEAEIKMLAAAVTAIYKDVGTFPTRDSAGANSRLYTLYSGDTAPASGVFVGGHSFISWAANATRGDSMDNQLLTNTPQGAVSGAYPTTGSSRWRGPYLAGTSPVDPWGRPYLINTISAFSNNTTRYKRIFVLSAGPDGRINTNRDAGPDDDIAGDDIGIVIFQRS